METKYKVGDKVRVRKDLVLGARYRMEGSGRSNGFVGSMADLKGKVVTIEAINGGQYIVKEDKPTPLGSRFNWTDEMFEPINQKILITTDGTTVLARQYEGQKVVKSAEAKCSPDDTFDFMIGAKLAFERLTGETAKPEPQALRPVIKDFKDIKTDDVMLILAEPHDQRYGARFKKHSFVTVLDARDARDDHSALCHGVLTDGTTTDAWVHFDEAILFDGGVEPQAVPEPEKPKFKVGDIVKVIGRTHYGHGLAIGSYAVITKQVSSGYEFGAFAMYGVKENRLNCVINQTLAEVDFERVDPAKVQPVKPKYEVGEIVRAYGLCDFEDGTLLEIMDKYAGGSIRVKGVDKRGVTAERTVSTLRTKKLHPDMPKIGDLVRITDNNPNRFALGAIAIVVSVPEQGDLYKLHGLLDNGTVDEQAARLARFEIVTVREEAKA